MNKFLDTNISVENFVSSFKKFRDELPNLIVDWETFDHVLQEEYLDQMSWLLSKAVEFIENNSPANIKE